MKKYILYKNIDIDEVEKILDWIHETKEIPDRQLIICSLGGPYYLSHMVIDELNNNMNITVIAENIVYGGAFNIFMDSKNPKIVGPYFLSGMAFLANAKYLDISDLISKDPNTSLTAIQIKSFQRIHKWDIRKKSEYMSKEEIAILKKGEEVNLSRERVIEMAEIRNKKNKH